MELRCTVPWRILLLSGCLYSCLIIGTQSFNIATNGSLLIKHKPIQYEIRNTYFGYSVGLFRRSDSTVWLIVGAPRSNITGYNKPVEPGTVYRCRIDKRQNKCNQEILDVARNGDHLTMNIRTVRSYGWAGATIDTNQNGETMVCAPSAKTAIKATFNYMTGMCYRVEENWIVKNRTIPVLYQDSYISGYNDPPVYYYAHGQFGMSAHYLEDPNLILVGAPGVFNWQGIVGESEFVKRDFFNPGGNRRRRSVEDFQFRAPGPEETTSIDHFSYFGYSVTSGHFSRDDVFYVGGAPRANDFRGLVIIFQLNNIIGYRKLKITELKYGQQIGEYFGSSVGTSDLNGDGLDDLIVGAPFYSTSERKEAGCIYVFHAKEATSDIGPYLENEPIRITVTGTPGARFGTAIGLPGDLNADGYEDVLIGAPYQDNTGAVYVFNGNKNGIETSFSQVILPSEYFPGNILRGFGFSFSRPLDVDRNFYPDIAIGSFLSNHVAVMYTRPVVSLSGSLNFIGKLQEGVKSFEITSCSFYSGKRTPDPINVRVRLDILQFNLPVESVSFTSNGLSQYENILKLKKGERTCYTHSISIISENFIYRDPLDIHMNQELVVNTALNGTVNVPIGDKKNHVKPIQISFITDCEKDGNPLCTTNLDLQISIKDHSMHDRIVIGRTEIATLLVTVLNTAEPAFYANITVAVQKPVKFLLNTKCNEIPDEQNSIAVCQLSNPIKKKDEINIDLDLKELSDITLDSSINVTIASASDLELNKINTRSLPLRFQKDILVRASGFTDPEQLSYQRISKTDIDLSKNIPFVHTSTIEKIGDTPIEYIDISLVIPTQVMDAYGVFFPILTINKTKLSFYGERDVCKWRPFRKPSINAITNQVIPKNITSMNCSSEFFKCNEVVCHIGPWKHRIDVAALEIKMILNMSVISRLISATDGTTITTDIRAKVAPSPGKVHKESWSAYKEINIKLLPSALSEGQTAPWWIYLLGILGGILLIILIAYGLHKVGFFKRKNRDEMISHRANVVKSQT